MSMRKRFASGVVGAVAGALALSGCSIYDVPLPGGADVGDDAITVNVKFRDVLDLVPQSTVKVNDVTVGKVTKIDLQGYTADVEMSLPGDLDLPDNARAEIRQTSLLGEKFVSLSAPAEPSADTLGDGDVIGLDNSGRNPEVEEVLGALGALLSGGGVGQLKLIAEELNTAMGGREGDVREVIDQIRRFTGELAENKESIVSAIDNLNRLAIELRKQDGTIKSALDNLPAALSSIDKQRDDLVRVLNALEDLSGVGTRVIRDSKESTINSLRDLAPILTAFADAGQDLPDALQVFLTYPFVDEAVGRDPEVARNLHMGDFTNLSVRLDLDLLNPPNIPGLPDLTAECEMLRGQLLDQAPAEVTESFGALLDTLSCDQLDNLTALDIQGLIDGLLGGGLPEIPGLPSLPSLPGLGGTTERGTTQGGTTERGTTRGGGNGGLLGGLLGGLGLGRAGLGATYQVDRSDPLNLEANGYDPGLGTLLLQGLLGSEDPR